MRLDPSETAASRNRLTTGEAVELALSAAADDAFTGGARVTDRERVRAVAMLLHGLLHLDDPLAPNRRHVPGALLVLVARGMGQMDLPPLTFEALTAGLRRFAPAQPAASGPASQPVEGAAPAAAPAPRPWTSLRVPRAAAAAAVLAAAFLGVAVPLLDDEPRVRVVTEDVTVGAPGGTTPGTPPTPRRTRLDVVAATPLLSAAAVGTEVFSPSFARNGRDLFVHAGRTRSALVRVSFDGKGRPALATLLHDGAANYHATPSPDGTWLAYDSDRDGTRAVYVARADASGARKVSGAGYAAVPKWSPDGRRLAFLKAEPRRPRVWNVWVADLAAGTLTRVSRHRFGQAWGASWFPDGARLAYSVEDRLVIADLQRGTSRMMGSPRRGGLIRTPAVSPDGRWVVFQVYRDGAWLLEIATGRMRRVLDDPTAEEFAWSPDSRRIIYHTERQGTWSVWQLAVDPAA
jgi:Tol biopolymer transport system component